MRVGIAYPAFFTAFKHFYPNLEVVKGNPFNYDLIIFSGGEDINPQIYGQDISFSEGISPERDRVEVGILETIFNNVPNYDLTRSKLYLLGVCRGHQLINAYLRGNLVQDIFMNLNVTHSGRHGLDILVQNSDMLDNFKIKDGEYLVNSLHHQAVVRTGSSLVTTSVHKKVIESTENDRIISVQWHPEFMDSYKFFEWVNKIIGAGGSFFNTKKSRIKQMSAEEFYVAKIKPTMNNPFRVVGMEEERPNFDIDNSTDNN